MSSEIKIWKQTVEGSQRKIKHQTDVGCENTHAFPGVQ